MFIYLLIGSKDTCETKQSKLDEDGETESDTETCESGGLNKNKEGKENVGPDNLPKKRRRKRVPKVCAIMINNTKLYYNMGNAKTWKEMETIGMRARYNFLFPQLIGTKEGLIYCYLLSSVLELMPFSEIKRV